ncbi:MAG: thioredoxin domain-containing protein [Alphaproteobacteria bacterium]|nr:thioredoxin domain-containing protein [Alphaproteobacteria bacterium]
MSHTLRNALIIMGLFSGVNGSAMLDSKYIIAYGNPKAPIQIVEYFSFGCASCLRTFAEEFEGTRETYINTGRVHWVMHPHPVDLITVQAMVCLEALTDQQRQVFLEAVVLEHVRSPEFGILKLMTAAMDVLKVHIPDITDATILQSTPAFKAAFTYQQATPAFSGTPTIFINGRLIDAFPTRSVIDELIQTEEGRQT